MILIQKMYLQMIQWTKVVLIKTDKKWIKNSFKKLKKIQIFLKNLMKMIVKMMMILILISLIIKKMMS